jgi:hypothetical protein
MRIREITESHMGMHTPNQGPLERSQDQRLLEKPRTRKLKPKRLKDNIGYNIGMGGPHGGNWGNSKI